MADWLQANSAPPLPDPRIAGMAEPDPLLGGIIYGWAMRDDIVAQSCRLARTVAARETELPSSTLPETCPYAWSDVMETPHDIDEGQG